MLTGDRRFGPGNPRYDLQAAAVEQLAVVFVGPGSWWPAIPAGPLDVVTTQDPFWRGIVGWRAARLLNSKLNVQVHADLLGQTFFKHMLAHFVLRRADTIRVVSQKIQQQVRAMGIQTPARVLPIFVDTAPFRALVHVPHTQPTLLWIGRFEKEKDPLLAIGLLREVRANGIGARLVMLGSGTLEEKLKTVAAGLPVEFPGWQDPKPYLAQADVVVSTSPYESYGASIIEALAAGVPVVALDVGVAREAGAVVASYEFLGKAVVETLRGGLKGELRLQTYTAEEWQRAWKESLN